MRINNKLKKLISCAELVIFDMNGLIVNDEPVQLKAANLAFKKYGVKISVKYWVEKCVGHRTRDIFGKILVKNKIKDLEALGVLVEEQVENYKTLMKDNTKKLIRKNVVNLIEELWNKKKMAVGTSAKKEEVEIILGKSGLNLKRKFRVIVTGDEVKKGKPDPEIYLKVARKLKIKPAKCLVFEDAKTGVEAAHSAGMKVVAMPSKFTKVQNFSEADLVLLKV